MKKYVYIDGRICEEKEAALSPLDRGITLGDGIFETILLLKGRPVFLGLHLERLFSGLRALNFEVSRLGAFFDEVGKGLVTDLAKKNGLEDTLARLRITITRGTIQGGLSAVREAAPTRLITVAPIDIERIETKKRRGIKAITVDGLRPALPGVKTTNFMPNILAACRARDRGAQEAFFLGPDNKTVLEGTTSNLFIVKKDRLITTPAAEKPEGPGVLAGVVRQTILELTERQKIPAEENWFSTDDLYEADEAFITNSISGVVPVVKTDDCKIGDGRPGETTRTLQKKYEEKIRKG